MHALSVAWLQETCRCDGVIKGGSARVAGDGVLRTNSKVSSSPHETAFGRKVKNFFEVWSLVRRVVIAKRRGEGLRAAKIEVPVHCVA